MKVIRTTHVCRPGDFAAGSMRLCPLFGLAVIGVLAGCRRNAIPEPLPSETSHNRAAASTADAGKVGDDANDLQTRFRTDTRDGSEKELVASIRSRVGDTALVIEELDCKTSLCKLVTSAPTLDVHTTEFAKVIGPGSPLMSKFAGCQAVESTSGPTGHQCSAPAQAIASTSAPPSRGASASWV